MNESKLVSVIIPVYNVKQFLKEAIDSVINQTYRNIEVIIVDDGSTDGSEIICNEYKRIDERIIVIHQKNKSLSSARNVGLDNASGEVIAFLDPDDAYHPRMLQIMMDEMNKQSTDIVICNYAKYNTLDIMNPTNIDYGRVECININKNQALKFIIDGKIETAVWNKIYDRSIWNDIRFPEGYVFEGTYIVFDLFDKISNITILNDKLMMHRNRPFSICNTRSLKNILDGQYATEHYLEFVFSHTPDIFSFSQVKGFINRRLKYITSVYLNYRMQYSEDLKGIQKLQNTYERIRGNMTLNYCSLIYKIAYYFVLFFPNFNTVLYKILTKIKHRRYFNQDSYL